MRVAAMVMVLALGCGGDSTTDEPVAPSRLPGRSLNGRSLNGRSLNGRSLNGRSHNGRSLDGAALGGLRVEGGALVATAADGTRVTGAGLIGAVLEGDGVRVRVDDVETHDRFAEAQLYWLSVAEDGGWEPLCRAADGAEVPSLPLAGAWSPGEGVAGGGAWTDDPSAITMACRGYALAKCVELLGYRPWKGHGRQHRACVRLLRADYCGDGSSWTADGNPVNVYDDVGVQSDTELWLPEAEWTEAGAMCLTKERYNQLQVLGDAGLLGQHGVPPCAARLVSPTCGGLGRWQRGAALVSEVPLTLSLSVL